MKIWKNTSTLNGFDNGLNFTESKKEASLALIGSKKIDLKSFPNLKGIFRAGIGRDNVPEKEAKERGIIVSYPSNKTIETIFEETASFTCSLIFRMIYGNIGTINPWFKESRGQLKKKKLLVVGVGKIGIQVSELMRSFLNVQTFDILHNQMSELKRMMSEADCITIHIPKTEENTAFIDAEKLSWMKKNAILINTARGPIVDEDALYAELKNKRLIAAFDVFWQEPYYGRLKDFHPDFFYMSPHVASTCIEFLKGCRSDLDNFLISIG